MELINSPVWHYSSSLLHLSDLAETTRRLRSRNTASTVCYLPQSGHSDMGLCTLAFRSEHEGTTSAYAQQTKANVRFALNPIRNKVLEFDPRLDPISVWSQVLALSFDWFGSTLSLRQLRCRPALNSEQNSTWRFAQPPPPGRNLNRYFVFLHSLSRLAPINNSDSESDSQKSKPRPIKCIYRHVGLLSTLHHLHSFTDFS